MEVTIDHARAINTRICIWYQRQHMPQLNDGKPPPVLIPHERLSDWYTASVIMRAYNARVAAAPASTDGKRTFYTVVAPEALPRVFAYAVRMAGVRS